ncbi:Cytosolic Fe-S cluster assembly factor nar1 [Pseudogymnoascus destructans]|uniref:Nuclear architecture-related protein 1 n=2 Tax=Pseudogymnoascus destructans TaxID=655981 RepID=L8FLI4_PSED2|nr:Cytosolic Fe-S cluster assembly factor nar1 [Pseudogymnoascus destructans]ELR01750.1 hypothetical protein GMDG_00126 [Pseudogymnoascus destructans 20631-21]OAF62217.1 Cytosolic Fe-S cluster assembly factor nar1 [Pseudogymnoascus destructans]
MSAILSADDLNDFISPGVACIKPIETLPPPAADDNPYELKFSNEAPLPSDLPPAEISLTDCLACSGCVTSAEAVLVSLQSHAEVLNALDTAPALQLGQDGGIQSGVGNQDGRIYIASVSPQSRASISAAYGVSEREAGYMIEQLLSGPQGLRIGGEQKNGFQWVVDTNVAREACLVLGAEEVAASMQGRKEGPTKPILTSSCPGWICYAEKTHPHVLPHLSRLKSPQALMGTLLKTTLSKKLKISPDMIWHVAVMPCFDKKLEASREELTDIHWDGEASPGTKGVRDVDCVLTSKELIMLAESRGIDFAALPRSQLSTSQSFPDQALHNFLFPPRSSIQSNGDRAAGTSGGNLHYILQYFASQHPGSTIQTTRGRNADVMDYNIISSSGETLFKTARYYGFRNIQNLVRKLKPVRPSRMPGGRPVGAARKPVGKAGSSVELSYVEVMACPGGCTNGGGQIKVDDPIVAERLGRETKSGPQEQKEWLAAVDEAYFSGSENGVVESSSNGEMEVDTPSDTIYGISPSHIKNTLSHWADITDIPLEKLAYTSYRAVISDVGKDKTTDTERVVQLAGKIGGGW